MYFDETTYNTWKRVGKSFWHAGENMPVTLPKNRGKGITVFGGLGTCIHGTFYGEMARSTNKVDF